MRVRVRFPSETYGNDRVKGCHSCPDKSGLSGISMRVRVRFPSETYGSDSRRPENDASVSLQQFYCHCPGIISIEFRVLSL